MLFCLHNVSYIKHVYDISYKLFKIVFMLTYIYKDELYKVSYYVYKQYHFHKYLIKFLRNIIKPIFIRYLIYHGRYFIYYMRYLM